MPSLRPHRALYLLLLLYLLAIASFSCYLTYETAMLDFHHHPGVYDEAPVFSGTAQAPDQYRIAIPYLARSMAHLMHTPRAYIATTLIDIVSLMAALLLLVASLRLLPAFRAAREAGRAVMLIALLALVQVSLPWVHPWARIETVPTILSVALYLYLLARGRTVRRWLLLLLPLVLWQTLVRADVMFALGLGTLIAHALLWKSRSPQRDTAALAAGALTMFIAGAGQLILQRVIYPQAHYPPNTPVIRFADNMHPRNVVALVISTLPVALGAWLVLRYRAGQSAESLVAWASASIYLALWLAVGLDVEVRVVLPFLLAVCPSVAVSLWGLVQDCGRNESLIPEQTPSS